MAGVQLLLPACAAASARAPMGMGKRTGKGRETQRHEPPATTIGGFAAAISAGGDGSRPGLVPFHSLVVRDFCRLAGLANSGTSARRRASHDARLVLERGRRGCLSLLDFPPFAARGRSEPGSPD